MEHREDVCEKIQRKVRYLLWNSAQLEVGRNGGAFRQRGQGRMEVCSECRERITHGTTGSEDRKHTSGGLFVAVDSNLGAVVERKKGRLSRFQATKEELPKHG